MASKQKHQKGDAKYESWKPAFMDLVVSVGLGAILYWIGPEVYDFLAKIPDPGMEIIRLHSTSSTSWWDLIFSLRTLGLVVFFAAVWIMWKNRENFTLMRGLRWSAFTLIVICLLCTGKPNVVTEPLFGGVVEMSMTLYRVLTRSVVFACTSLAAALALCAILVKSLQIFLLAFQAGEFLILESLATLVFDRPDIAGLSVVGALAALFHMDALDQSGSSWVAILIGAFIMLGVNAIAFYLLTWPYLARAQIIVVP